jgi:hypothetical protein
MMIPTELIGVAHSLETLDEERAANEKLNELAEAIVNPEALSESEEFATGGSPCQ